MQGRLKTKPTRLKPRHCQKSNIMAEDVDANDKTEEDAQSETETDDGLDEMTYFEALKTFVFGIALPTWDIITDIRFIIQLLIPACYHNRYQLGFLGFDIFSKYRTRAIKSRRRLQL